jgi:hemerythrin-like metal-binding protein
MNAIAWSESFALQQPRMDRTHQEFVALLQRLSEAAEHGTDGLDALLAELAEHSVVHFEQEERWMGAIGFAADNCHSMQHRQVLQVVDEVRETLRREGRVELVRVLARELGNWFVAHAQTMDSALVQMMAEQGFDPETGRIARPVPLATPITGCGGSSCS